MDCGLHRIRRRISIGIGIGLMACALLAPGASLAHHSTAAYDQTKPTPLSGTVKSVQWTNPHSWIQLVAADSRGPAEWAIEFGNPIINLRNGWKRNDVKPGDKVAMIIYPMRDGSAHGTLASITLADGRHLDGAADFVPKAIQKLLPPAPPPK